MLTAFVDVSRTNVEALGSSLPADHWIVPLGVEPPGDVEPTWFRSPLDLDSLGVADQFVAAMIDAVHEQRPRDADDLRIARFELATSLAPVLQRWDVLAQAHALGTTNLHWILERDSPPRVSNLSGFRRSVPGLDINVSKVGRRRTTTSIREHLYQTRRRIVRYGSRHLDRTSGLAGDPFVFVEFFPNNVKATWPIAQELLERGASVAWMPTRAIARSRVIESELRGAQQLVNLREPRWVPTPTDDHLRLTIGELISVPRDPRDAAPWLLDQITALVRRHLAQARGWRHRFEAILGDRPLPAVVTSTPYEVSARAAVAVAKRNGIPSAFVQHGAYGERWGHRYIDHDLLLVWGDYEAASLRRLTGSRVEVIGSTVHEDLIGSARYEPATFGEPPLNVVYLASNSRWHYSYSEADRLARTVGDVAGKLGSAARWTYKLHPHDTTGVQERAVRGNPHIYCTRFGDSRDLTREADIVIVRDSTAGYEACVLGVPLIELDIGHRVQPVFYAASGAALRASTAAQLLTAVRTIACSASVRESLSRGRDSFVRQMLAGAVPGAPARAADLLLRVSGSS